MPFDCVERWNLTDDTHSSYFVATNEKGELRPWGREQFVSFMERFGFRLELRLDEAGPHWTDGIVRVWHDNNSGITHDAAECDGFGGKSCMSLGEEAISSNAEPAARP
jgi:hypothetical protein